MSDNVNTAPYDQIAAEYYDVSHQTSRNFDQTSGHALQEIRELVPENGLVLDVGAGRGRCNEFLGIDTSRVIHLDNSREMIDFRPREASRLRVLHQAECLPFLNAEFSCVTAFLCDPFLGLNFLHEAYRVLTVEGLFVATTPSYEWGMPLRAALGISAFSTRFITRNGKVMVPSILIPRNRLIDMLEFVGFSKSNIEVSRHRLPEHATPISPDIKLSAERLGCGVHELEILYVVVAKK